MLTFTCIGICRVHLKGLGEKSASPCRNKKMGSRVTSNTENTEHKTTEVSIIINSLLKSMMFLSLGSPSKFHMGCKALANCGHYDIIIIITGGS